MDGCSPWANFLYVFLPLAAPGLVTVALFAFLTSWNEFLAALIFMNREFSFTVPILLVSVRTGDHGAVEHRTKLDFDRRDEQANHSTAEHFRRHTDFVGGADQSLTIAARLHPAQRGASIVGAHRQPDEPDRRAAGPRIHARPLPRRHRTKNPPALPAPQGAVRQARRGGVAR